MTPPQDFSDDWQDLDDLLEDALEGEHEDTSVGPHDKASGGTGMHMDKKLSELDALLKAEAVACDNSVSAEHATAPSEKALETFLGGGSGRGDRDTSSVGELGEEERRLLQMVRACCWIFSGCDIRRLRHVQSDGGQMADCDGSRPSSRV